MSQRNFIFLLLEKDHNIMGFRSTSSSPNICVDPRCPITVRISEVKHSIKCVLGNVSRVDAKVDGMDFSALSGYSEMNWLLETSIFYVKH